RDRDRQVVDPQRPRDEADVVVPVPEQQARGRRQGEDGEAGRPALGRPEDAAHQDHDQPDGQRDHRREAGVVDVRGYETFAGPYLLTLSLGWTGEGWRKEVRCPSPRATAATVSSCAVRSPVT